MSQRSELDEKVSISNIKIYFDKKITEIEKSLIKTTIERYESAEISKTIKIKNVELLKLIKVDEKSSDMDELIYDFLSKFMKKQINYSYFDKDKNKKCKGFFPIIASVVIEKDFILVNLPEEIISAYQTNNIFEKIGIIPILKLDFWVSSYLYLYLISNNTKSEDVLYFPLDDFRNLLNIGEIYDRFYDFEKNILIPIIEDINTNTNFRINFSKIKSGLAKSSRVIGINIEYENIILKKKETEVNQLFSLIKDKVNDFQKIHNLISASLDIYEFSHIYSILELAKKNNKKNLDQYLEEHIPLSNKKLTNIKNEKLMIIEKEIKTLYELHLEVNKALLSVGAGVNLPSDLLIYKKLYKIKPEEEFNVCNEDYEVSVFYSLNKKSVIKIKRL